MLITPYDDPTSFPETSTTAATPIDSTAPSSSELSRLDNVTEETTEIIIYQTIYLVVLWVCLTICFLTVIFTIVVICYVRYREKQSKHKALPIRTPTTGPLRPLRRVEVGLGAPPPSIQGLGGEWYLCLSSDIFQVYGLRVYACQVFVAFFRDASSLRHTDIVNIYNYVSPSVQDTSFIRRMFVSSKDFSCHPVKYSFSTSKCHVGHVPMWCSRFRWKLRNYLC